jgi:hypothetical protein
MQGLAIRIAKALNRILARSAQVWADRYGSAIRRPALVAPPATLLLRNG